MQYLQRIFLQPEGLVYTNSPVCTDCDLAGALIQDDSFEGVLVVVINGL